MSDVPKLKASPNWTNPPREMRPGIKHRESMYDKYVKMDMDMSNSLFTKTLHGGGQERNYSTTLQMQMQEEMHRERALERERDRDQQREFHRQRDRQRALLGGMDPNSMYPLTFDSSTVEARAEMDRRTREALQSMAVPNELLSSDSEGSSS